MMKFSELLSRLMAWRKNNEANPVSLDEAEQQYSQACERERRIRVGVLRRRSDFLDAELQRLQAERDAVEQSLKSLQSSRPVALPTPPRALPVPRDISPLDQYGSIQEAKKNMADLLGSMKSSSLEKNPVQQLYNPALLDQESDELLHYL